MLSNGAGTGRSPVPVDCMFYYCAVGIVTDTGTQYHAIRATSAPGNKPCSIPVPVPLR